MTTVLRQDTPGVDTWSPVLNCAIKLANYHVTKHDDN